MVAAFIMVALLLWTLFDCISEAGQVVLLRSLINILLAAFYITFMMRLLHRKDALITGVAMLAIMLACMGTAELAAHFVKKKSIGSGERSEP